MINYAFIFARGGSKGLPRKNVKLLAGKPLIQYSIEIGLSSPSISKVFVSTDDHEIATIAKSAGAIVIDRPAELATDTAYEWLAWHHAIEWVNAKQDCFDGFISLPVTSPLRSVEDVENALVQRRESNADVCISVTPANRSPFFNMVKKSESGYMELVNKLENNVTRRQDAPELYDMTTVIYATTPEFVLQNKSIFDGKVTSIVVPKARAVDIDDIYDFMLAEAILLSKENEK
ncbi:cytidylyltransferase domain-containing protein [Photorhabdus aegyptia]|uniref:CMP-N-acetylneuraminic acid synthetase n=1 Tax=Photorhabdus aegyptia TaxID=2805098 RepID=A0A022PH09_9GAMM|nr:acylneuraminate cytidylyltransferase family protein [Photorhabdus aegyptia]EYU14228.1 CMP-N-acetylneuraminic acid synthetase [Photorhabdus aegyptia]KGM27562.1 acylneuraminate cytidylyltransferase [Photorhabdus luminescens]